jgi:hypothetical protein
MLPILGRGPVPESPQKWFKDNLYSHAKLYHYESATKTKIARQREVDYMKSRSRTYIRKNPHYTPNLARKNEDYSLHIDGSTTA